MKNISQLIRMIGLFIGFTALAWQSGHAQQDLKAIQVIDQQYEEPIIGVLYRYGKQNGVSSEQGFIYLQKEESAILELSHLSYGKWILEGEELKQAWQKGKIYRKEYVQTLLPITVISLKPYAVDPQHNVSISDRERLHHDAGAILNQDPVINAIRKSGSFGWDPVMRGFKYDQLNVVLDGIQSANAACPNRMDPPSSQIALNRVKEIEILKGPHALRYGNAIGGTINFVQEQGQFNEKPHWYGRYSSMFESNGGVWRQEARIGNSRKGIDWGALGSWSKGGNYLDGNGDEVPAHFERGSLGAYADFRLGKKDMIFSSVNRNFARDVAFPTLGMDLRSDDTWMLNLRHERMIGGKNLRKWTNSVFFSRVDHLMDNGLREMPRMANARTPALTMNYGGRSEGKWQIKKGQMYAGIDYRLESARGIREREILMGPMAGRVFFDNAWQQSQIEKTGIFASYQLPFLQYIFSAAARVEHNLARATDPTEEFLAMYGQTTVQQINPGLSAGLKRDFSSGISASLWLARVQRSASITERYIN